ncbi:hypothetical protein [Streptomyces sp. NBC_00212]|uniref:hypothetical protein n=1 Tax=Streptomyces sp. NBC_00212 TaxID=2975684 RepID=UPI0032494DF9
MIDCVGDDWPGSQVRELPAEGDVPFAPLTSPAGTRRAVNLVAADGRRMSTPAPPTTRTSYSAPSRITVPPLCRPGSTVERGL